MKFPKILVAAILMIAISCEKDENEEARMALEGHWHIWDFEPSANSPEEASLLAKDAILKLVSKGCDPIEFTFKSDQTVSYSDGMRYLQATSTEEGVDVSCAPQYDDKNGTFDFDNEQLTLNFKSETITYDAAIEGKYLTTQVDNMIINDIAVSGKLYFIIETGE
jgi:hypothetical protein